MTDTTLEEFENTSRIFVAALDREPLGRFATPVEALEAVDTMLRVFMTRYRLSLSSDHFDSNDSVYSAAEQRAVSLCFEAGMDTEIVQDELFFWWSISGEPLWADIGNLESDINGLSAAAVERLGVIYAHPEMHDYFAADLWDVDFIERCIGGGIDVELALSIIR